jgi:hypothetical protein
MLDRHGIDLLEGLLAYSPSDRLVGKDALAHPYFDDLDRDSVGKGGAHALVSPRTTHPSSKLLSNAPQQ